MPAGVQGRLDRHRGRRQRRSGQARGVQVADTVLRHTGVRAVRHRGPGGVHKNRVLGTVRQGRAHGPSGVGRNVNPPAGVTRHVVDGVPTVRVTVVRFGAHNDGRAVKTRRESDKRHANVFVFVLIVNGIVETSEQSRSKGRIGGGRG